MDLRKLKKRNRVLLLVLLAGFAAYVAVEGVIAYVESGEMEWETVNTDVEALLEEESAFVPPEPQMININEASREELETLDGIGPKKAEEIVRYRETEGPFLNKEQIMEVKGIGEAIYGRIKDRITVGQESAAPADAGARGQDSEMQKGTEGENDNE